MQVLPAEWSFLRFDDSQAAKIARLSIRTWVLYVHTVCSIVISVQILLNWLFARCDFPLSRKRSFMFV